MKKWFTIFSILGLATNSFSQLPQDWEGKVMTVKGLINSEAMGITLPHEHLLIVHKFNYLDLTNEADAIEEVGYFKAAGGKTVADASAIGIGRNPAGLKRISNATGLNVLMCTGFYKDQWIHDTLKSKSIEQLTDIMINDIINGINGIHAGFIKLGISKPITAFEEKAVRAAARAQVLTGVAIELHFDGDRATLAEKNHVLDVLENGGVDLSRVIVDHNVPYTYLVNDFISLANRGCYIAFDMIGLEVRVVFLDELKLKETLLALINAGYLDHLLLSQDVCFSVCYVKNGGYGYAHILNNIVPELLAGGITSDQIHTMMVDNPKNVFPFKNTGFCINETFTSETGTISDNSGLSDYNSDMACQKLIKVQDATNVMLQFTSFDTEPASDFVRVYDGETTSSPLLGEFSGTSIPESLTSTGGSMLITFTSDEGTEAGGWSADYVGRILKVEPENKQVESSGGTASFKIKSNIQWLLNENESWLTATKSNDSTILISFEINSGINPRQGDITITGQGVNPLRILISQTGADPFITITPETVTVESQSGSSVFKVASNTDWAPIVNQPWVIASKLNDTVLTITYGENRTIEPRSAEITVGDTTLISQIIQINQSAADPVLDIDVLSISTDADSGSMSLKVLSNLNWMVSENSDYLFASKINDSIVVIHYDENLSIDSRSSDIWIGDTEYLSQIISFDQSGAAPFMTIDPQSLSLSADFGMIDVKILTNMGWTVIENTSWISAVKTNDSTMLVVYDSNATIDARSADIIVYGSEFMRTLSIEQEGAVIDNVSPGTDNHALSVYPNPARDRVTIVYRDVNADFIEIYDYTGLLVKKISDAAYHDEIEIDFSGLNAGVYLYRLVDTKGRVYQGKIVKE